MPLKPLSGSSPDSVPAATAAVLRALASRAGVIFAGQVVRVDREDARGYVEVVFRIDVPVQVRSQDSHYVLREWAGLWAGHAARYCAGQKLLMLLTEPGPSGLSSPVGGLAGAIPLLATRQPPLLHGNDAAPAYTPAEAAQEEAVDLRWVQALATRGLVLNRFRPEGLPPIRQDGSYTAAQPLEQSAAASTLSAVLAVLQPSLAGRVR